MSQGAKHKPTEADRKLVSGLVGFGVRHDEISVYMGISKPTLYKYYREELDTGAIRANVQVARAHFNNAISGNTTAQIFWLKARAGWVETTEVRNLGPNGGPMQHEHTEKTSYEGLTDDELLQLRSLQQKAADAARQRDRTT